MTDDTQTIIYGIIALISVIIILFAIYSYKRTKNLRLLGYEFLYYYMKNCGKLDYYRNASNHISSKYKASYNEIVLCQNKWYVWKGRKEIIKALIDFYDKADKLTERVSPFFMLNHYFTFSECQKYNFPTEDLESMMKQIVNKECKKYVIKKYADVDFKSFPLEHQYKHLFESSLRPLHNKEFVEKELRDNKNYFDTLLRYPLDSQQRESVVKLEDNCLVISSAGSGKTSTTIAKVKYLLDKRNINPENILVLSYNRKTAEEFRERLNLPSVECKTFHKKASEIIAAVERRYPDVCDESYLLTCFYNLIRNDSSFKRAVNEFVSIRSSITKNLHDYQTSKDYFKDRMTYGIMAPYGDMNGNTIFTRSEEEKKICTWLSSHGINFLYEQPYPIDTFTEFHRQYKPDFTIYYERDGQRNYVFLEHFGINRFGNVPSWFGNRYAGGFYEANRKYHNEIQWKRRIHQQFNTCLLETTSAMFQDGTIYQMLETQLQEHGIVLRELSEDEKFERLIVRNPTMEESIMNLFTSFINLMKSNGKTFDQIMNSIRESGKSEAFCERCRFLMYELIKPLYDEYERGLQVNHQMDFTDIILRAAEYCDSGRYNSSYSYILVDEFQDISVDRFKLIKAMIKDSPRTKTFCVGDDWQSIYRFSGSDMNLFNHFEQFFGFTERCKIETTYRFGNPLVQKSSEFILKNQVQEPKEVHPFSNEITTELSFIPFVRYRNEDYLNKIEEVIRQIPADETVILLGRYNNEVNIFPESCIHQVPNSKRVTVTYANRTMNFMSVHSSKGLEADNVLILNCSQDKGGFPSRIADDPILAYVLSKIDDFLYSEERRLFYVAITRAKKHTFVLYNENMPSFFVKEMIEEDGNTMRCPYCGLGVLALFREGTVNLTGDSYRIYKCNNSIGGCDYQWTVYNINDIDEIIAEYHRRIDGENRPLNTQDIPAPRYIPRIYGRFGGNAPAAQATPPTSIEPDDSDLLPF